MTSRTNVMRAASLGTALVLGLTGCALNGSTDDSGGQAAEPISVLAAASLISAFETIVEDFSAEHPEIAINPLVTGGSQELVQQVIAGAPADVIALASEPAGEPLEESGVATDFSVFAENTLVIVVQAGNPRDVQGLGDLTTGDLQVAKCAIEVPCGAATASLLELNNLEIMGATEETSVSAVIAKAELNEVDAAIVYRSDFVTSSGDLEAIEPALASEVVNRYPITSLGDNPGAAIFVEYVRSEAGTTVLEEAGLTVP